MKASGNTILITGGGSGIGLGLAEEFLKAGNTVLVAGRSAEKLKHAAARGLHTFTADMTNAESISALAREAVAKFPALNGVIHNAGIMQNENLLKGASPKVAEDTVLTNILGPMRLTDALLPHLLEAPAPFVMTVTSGLAYAPLAMTPAYSASKAAIHSYTESLRYQLKDTPVQIIELIPPYVRTGLMGERQAKDENAMPLPEFVAEVMTLLREKPDAREVVVKRVEPQRNCAFGGQTKYDEFFKALNDRMFAARKGEF